ncbi:K(+) efflux antiporter 4 [Elaeis guineensis]|uniref:K(+) efflux antiporter 4 n=1 Tax=Elaeis guineensis var. tenera TaxID=51953 RepID=UPI003C6CE9C6
MLIHVHFLWNHAAILLASVILVVIVKTVLVAMVIKAFGYITRTSFLVAVSLAQIGEFAFVLLSCASNLHLIEVTTSLMFKLIPAVMHLGILMHWFPAESNIRMRIKLRCLKLTTEHSIISSLYLIQLEPLLSNYPVYIPIPEILTMYKEILSSMGKEDSAA